MLNQSEKFSVVIPLYNKCNTIVATLESVLAQTRPVDEVIVVDDGSSDGSADLIRKHFGDKVIVLRQDNAGVSAARNNGISMAKGEYISFLDADDLWSPHYLEEVEQLSVRFPECGLLGARYQYIDEGGRFNNPKIRFSSQYSSGSCQQSGILDSYFSIAARGDLPFNASTVTLKKTLLKELKGFPVNEPMGEDQDVWARAALLSDIAYSPKVLGFYNRAADNRACVTIAVKQECPFSRRLHAYADQCTDQKLAGEILDYTAAHLRHLAKSNMIAGQFSTARSLLSDPRCARQLGKKVWLEGMMMTFQAEDYIRSFWNISFHQFFKSILSYNVFQSKEVQL